MLQEEIKKLEQVCRNLEGCIREGLSWVKENVPEENQKAIVYNLKKYNRTNRRYRQALGKRPAVTIFGESQVGKSYLVSNLAVKPGESNMLILDPSTDTTIDFIKEMNPKGGGAEATGLVSRFTIINNFKEGQPPFVLKLLSNADVVKIICNGYLSDLMQYSYKIDREEVANRLRKIKEKTLPAEQPGFSEDDVYELKEYLNHNFKDHFIIKELNDINYWDDISAIIPYLPNEERFTVFEVIWGTREFLTELFRNLTGILKQVEFSSEVRGYKEALTPQEQTILDVTRLSEYFMENISQKPVEVVLPGGSKIQANRSLITAVIAEVVLLLPPETAEAPNRGFLKSADILDFPGARSRKKIPEAIFLANSKVEKLEIFLRGKIAFLFDRYTYEHEISTLLFCLHEKQSEVQDIPHLLYEWIRVSHGASPEEREKREQNLKLLIGDADIERINPLLVVFTKFNIELTGSPSDKVGDPSSHDAKWTARFKRNFNEFMSPNVGDKWANQWTTSETDFKNCFLLRDPKFSKAVYTGLDSDNEGLETAINPNYVQRMDDMTESFLEHGYVKKHFDAHLLWM
ncbi:MAG: putative virulence factor [Bacteroidetes bacterium]|nr:putative virulence factor [Bacteroidota bacterium]